MEASRVGLPNRTSNVNGTKGSVNIAGSNRYQIRRGNMSSPWDIMGDRTEQAGITHNMDVNVDLFQSRQNNSKDVSGRRTMMDIVTNHTDIDIKENDLLLIAKVGRTNSGMITNVRQPYVFSSFTGINTLKSKFVTQEAFERGFYLVGKSKIEYRYDGTSTQNISVLVGGATTISNNGMTTFAPGDKIAWRAPSIDDSERSMQKTMIKKARNEPASKLTPFLERQSHADIFKLPNLALEKYANLTPSERNAVLTKHSDVVFRNRKEDSKDRMLQAMKTQTALAGLNTVMTLAQLGIIEIKLPDNPMDDAFVSNIADFSKITLEDLSRNTYKDRNNNGRPTPATQAESPAIRTKNWEHTKIIAQMLGLIPQSSGSSMLSQVPTMYGPTDAILKRTFRGLADEPTSSKFRDDASLLKIGPSDVPDRINQAGLGKSAEKIVNLAQINAPRDELIEFHEAYSIATEKVFATALNHSQPGSTIDVMM